MQRFFNRLFPLIVVILACTASLTKAAAYGVQDDGHFFSDEIVAQANDLINQIRTGDNRDVRVATFDAVPADKLHQMEVLGKTPFYEQWAAEIGKHDHVNGVVILMTREPSHLQIVVGNATQRGTFTSADRDELTKLMLGQLRQKQFDQALISGLQFIKQRMDSHPAAAQSAAQPATPSNTPIPSYPSSPSTPSSNPPLTHSSGAPIGTWLCLGVGILGVVFVIMAMANRNRSYGGPGVGGGPGYGAPGIPPQGGYPPNYAGGAYPQGGNYGQSGGGFGRGLLGGLLGGAIGSWGYDKIAHGSQSPNYAPPTPGPGGGSAPASQDDTSYSGSGGDFGSPASSGGDFGSSSDSSSGGGDFSSGSDSSSGGDFGGGGGSDSGSGGSGDF